MGHGSVLTRPAGDGWALFCACVCSLTRAWCSSALLAIMDMLFSLIFGTEAADSEVSESPSSKGLARLSRSRSQQGKKEPLPLAVLQVRAAACAAATTLSLRLHCQHDHH